jgi:transcriptional regulator with XRE-family HTH domain
MLSLIENGTARPSMDTLCVLAGRLGKPVGYFLEEDAVLSSNQSVMETARKAFGEGRHGDASAALKAYREPDPVFDAEAALLRAMCAMELARQAIREQRFPYAAALLEETAQAGEKTFYFGSALQKEWQFLQAKLRPELAAELCVDEELLLKAELVLPEDPARAAQLLDAAEDRQQPRWLLLRGRAALGSGAYRTAAELLHRAEPVFGEETAPLLESCYRELGDFKQAYAYACRQRR